MRSTLLRAAGLRLAGVCVCIIAVARADGQVVVNRNDANCDGFVNNFDIDAFTLALLDPGQYQATLPTCSPQMWEPDGDSNITNLDIDRFVLRIAHGPKWPVSTARLDCVSLLQAHTNEQNWRDAELIHSIQTPGFNSSSPSHWTQTVQATIGENPNLLWGTYLSGTATRKQQDIESYPREMMPYESTPLGYLAGPYDPIEKRSYIDLANSAARTFQADRIVAEALTRHAPLMLLDNMSHPETGGTLATWPEVVGYLQSIRGRLRSRGTMLMANLACQPWFIAGPDTDLMPTCLDGINLEQPFHWVIVRPFADRVMVELAVYEGWLNAGMHVSLMSGWSDIVYDPVLSLNEQRVLAGMCMMIHRPGVSLSVPRTAYTAAPEWAYWPTTFGPALGPYRLVSTIGPVFRREFQNATITVDLGKSMNPQLSASAVTVTMR